MRLSAAARMIRCRVHSVGAGLAVASGDTTGPFQGAPAPTRPLPSEALFTVRNARCNPNLKVGR